MDYNGFLIVGSYIIWPGMSDFKSYRSSKKIGDTVMFLRNMLINQNSVNV